MHFNRKTLFNEINYFTNTCWASVRQYRHLSMNNKIPYFSHVRDYVETKMNEMNNGG